MRKKILIAAIVIFMVVSINSIPNLFAKETSLDLNVTLNKLINAVETNDYNRFVEDGDDAFKAGLSRQMFDGVSGLMAERFAQGYTESYLGDLNQQGCRVHLWKVVFKDNGDDVLIRLVIKNARISGFWFQ